MTPTRPHALEVVSYTEGADSQWVNDQLTGLEKVLNGFNEKTETPDMQQVSPEFNDLDKFRNAASETSEAPETDKHKFGCLEIHTMNEWMQIAAEQPNPVPLCGELWATGELCILWGAPGLGKSLLAMMLADAIARGRQVFDELCNETGEPKKVLYVDMELSEKQLQKRYSNDYQDNYKFSDNVFRNGPILNDADILPSISMAVDSRGIEVVIIDNLTWIIEDANKSYQAADLMKYLKQLAIEKKISIMVIGHPKKRNTMDADRSLKLGDLSGSANFVNFADSVIAMGKGKEPETIYIKQLKARNSEMKYGDDNVIILKRAKIKDNFLGFEWVGTSDECDQINNGASKTDTKRAAVKSLLEQGLSVKQISSELNIPEKTVYRYRKQLNDSQNSQNSHA